MTTALEAIGLILVLVGAFVLSIAAGIIALGLVLLLAGYALETRGK